MDAGMGNSLVSNYYRTFSGRVAVFHILTYEIGISLTYWISRHDQFRSEKRNEGGTNVPFFVDQLFSPVKPDC